MYDENKKIAEIKERSIKNETERYNKYIIMIEDKEKMIKDYSNKIYSLEYDNETEEDAEVIEINNQSIIRFKALIDKWEIHLKELKATKKEIAKTIRKLKKELKIASKSIENGAKHETDR